MRTIYQVWYKKTETSSYVLLETCATGFQATMSLATAMQSTEDAFIKIVHLPR
jgi:hypothetical protein